MKLQKLSGLVMAYAQNFSDMKVFSHKELRGKINTFIESGQCVPTMELLRAMEKAGSNPQQLARVIVGHDMHENQKSYGGAEREQHERELATAIQAAHQVYKNSTKQKRTTPMSVVS